MGKNGKPNGIDLNGIQEISKSMQPMNIITKMDSTTESRNKRKKKKLKRCIIIEVEELRTRIENFGRLR